MVLETSQCVEGRRCVYKVSKQIQSEATHSNWNWASYSTVKSSPKAFPNVDSYKENICLAYRFYLTKRNYGLTAQVKAYCPMLAFAVNC